MDLKILLCQGEGMGRPQPLSSRIHNFFFLDNSMKGEGGTMGSDVTPRQNEIVIMRCRTMAGYHISTLIMVPINFWRNSDLFKKKRNSSSKIDKVRAFQRKSFKFFKENL